MKPQRTTETTKKPGQAPLVAQAYHQQAEFTISTPDPRATSLEDQRKMKTAYEPSPRYVESRTAADRHLKSLASIEAKDVPHWVLLMSKRMKDAPKEEHPYLAGKKESSDQMPGRTDSWELHQPGFQSLIKLTMESMRAARVVIFVDSTLRPVPEQGYLLADVVKVVLPGSSLKQMHAVAEYFMRHVVAPDVFVFSNLVDDLEAKGMLRDVLANKEGALARALSSQVEDIELIRRRIRESSRNKTQVAFASPPGFVFWKSKTLQMLTYALWEVSRLEKKGKEEVQFHYRICAPNLKTHSESMQLPELAYAAFFSEISKFLQKNIFPGMAANLTVDDPMCFDFGMWIAERVSAKDLLWNLPVLARQQLDDNFALTPAVPVGEKEPSLLEEFSEGVRKLERVKDSVTVAALPEARRTPSEEKPLGLRMIMKNLQDAANELIAKGGTYQQWKKVGKKTLWQLARELSLESLELVHLIGWTWSPAVIAKTHQLYQRC